MRIKYITMGSCRRRSYRRLSLIFCRNIKSTKKWNNSMTKYVLHRKYNFKVLAKDTTLATSDRIAYVFSDLKFCTRFVMIYL